MLLFTGDLCASGSFLARLQAGQPLLGPQLQALIGRSAGLVVNLEGMVLPMEAAPRIKNPPELLPQLRTWSVQAVNLANNHSFDAGENGYRWGHQQLAEAQLPCFGAGPDLAKAAAWLLIEHKGQRIALLGLSYAEGPLARPARAGVHGPPFGRRLRRLIAAARAQADHVVLCYHGAEEYTREPWPRRRHQLRRWATWGVSAIVGHHPHVPQGWEWVGSVPVFYSLGHFLFDQPHHRARRFTDEGLLVGLDWAGSQLRPQVYGLRLDRRQGTVELDPEVATPPIRGTRRAWRREAARVMQERTQVPSHWPTAAMDTAKAERPKWLKTSFYRTLWAYLSAPNSRAVLLGALMHRLSGAKAS